MKKITLILLSFFGLAAHAQIDYFQTTEGYAQFQAISNSGMAITTGVYYDYPTATITTAEAGVVKLGGMNNVLTYAGTVYYDEENSITQPAYKIGATSWVPIPFANGSIPPASTEATGRGVSENSQYFSGLMWDESYIAYPYLFDATTSTTTRIVDPENSGDSGAGYDVNDSGVVVGWYNNWELNAFSGRVPFYYDGEFHYITNDESLVGGEAYSINNNGIVVGHKGGKPFIYDINTDEFTSINIPSGYDTGEFLAYSDNGIAVGLVITVDYSGWFPTQVYDAIIYHPDLGNSALLLKDVLAERGLVVTTSDGYMGRATNISPDGNYLVGFLNNADGFNGWIIDFNDLLFDDNDCTIACPENIELTLPVDATTIAVDYTLDISCGTSSSDGLSVELVDGFASGESFSMGTTTVTHNLVNEDGDILYTCTFIVTVTDAYCDEISQYLSTIEPITSVQFAGIDNTSPADIIYDSPEQALVYYNDASAAGTVEQGNTYTLTVEGNTNGDYVNNITVFIDWNQNLILDDAGEVYDAGTLTNSTGTDGQQAEYDILVPADAVLGATRMRIIKSWVWTEDGNPTPVLDPCVASFYNGEVEDYTLNVTEQLSISDINIQDISFYPNPVNDYLNVTLSNKNIASFSLYTLTGQKVIEQLDIDKNTYKIDMQNLSTGIYILKITNDSGESSIKKVVKE